MGLFDGAFGGGGTGILPDWLFSNPQFMQNMPNAMAGGTPAGSFADMWSGVGQGMNSGALDPQGANNNAAYLAPFMQQTQAFPGGNLPMPQPRPPEAQQAYERGLVTPGGELPPNATPTAGLTPPNMGGLSIPGLSSMNLPSGNPFAGGSFTDPLGIAGPGQPLGGAADWINNNRTMLALFGAGIAGGGGTGNWNAGLSDALRGAAAGSQVDRQQQTQTQAQNAAYQAVKAAGGTEAQALAARSSPEVFKAIAPELFGGWKLVKTSSNPITGDVYEMQGPGGKLMSLDEFRRRGGGGEASGSSTPGGGGMLAPGVKNYDSSLTGDAYLAQFSPEVQSAVKAYMKGDVMPTGNPRLQGIAAVAKTIAQKYGQDIGQPVSDAVFSERRKYRTELGSNSATTAGGQAKAFVQGIEHADTLATKLEGLKNWNGLGVPFLAAGANAIRQGLSTNQAGLADEAKAIGQTLAGEVGKLFSGSAGGGVHERQMTRDRFSTISSGPQLAGALEGTIETMEGGLKALESRRDQVLGPDNDVKFVTKETEDKIAHIREVIARLKSGESAKTETTNLPRINSPAEAAKLPKGTRFLDPQGNQRVVP